MYIEVRYAKLTSLSLKESASVFRLRTREQKNLTTEEYGDNLMQYLGNARKVGHISTDDLRSTLLGLKRGHSLTPTEGLVLDDSVQIGEHVAIAYFDEDKRLNDWVLGIVDNVIDSRNIKITRMVSTKAKRKWVFPDEAEVDTVEKERVLVWNITVTYCQTAKICCTMKAELVSKLNTEVDKLNL